MARPRRYDDAVRRRLLEAASVALAEHGSEGVSLRAVATAASTTTAAVYTLFGGRESLLEEVVAEGFRRFASQLDAVPETDDPGEDLFRLGLAYRDSALAEPHFYRAMFERPAAPGHDTIAHGTFDRLRRAAARVLGPQGGDDGEPEALELALRLWALVHGLVALELGGHLPGDAATRERRYRETLLSERARDEPATAVRPARPPG